MEPRYAPGHLRGYILPSMNTVDRMMLRLLNDAGLTAGMAVLDAGSGHGNLAAMLAPIVGPAGRIHGVDRDGAAVVIAQQKMKDLGHQHVHFSEADLAASLPSALGTFDAIVGRRVLMYLPDPGATLRSLSALLKPGGLMIFQEIDASLHIPDTSLPLHEKWFERTWRTVRGEGADVGIGRRLGAMFSAAGIGVEEVRGELNIQTPTQDYPTEAIARFMIDRTVAQGVATREELAAEVNGLDARLLAEREEGWKTFVGETVFGVWGRKAA